MANGSIIQEDRYVFVEKSSLLIFIQIRYNYLCDVNIIDQLNKEIS